jgi:4-hydroxymandelate synthase
MAVQDIECIELFVADKQSAVDYFVSSLGFNWIAESSSAGASSSLLVQGGVKLVVTTGSGTGQFLEQHGDGVAYISLACDDVSATLDAAVVAGARVMEPVWGRPVVAAVGGVRHTLCARAAGSGTRMPAGRAWAAVAQQAGRRDGSIRLLDHVAICVEAEALQAASDFYGAAFGLARYSAEYVDIGEQGMDSVVVRSPSERVTFTLVAPDRSKSPGQLDAFLSRNCGPGVQHLAFEVADIISAVHQFSAQGVEFLHTPGSYYEMLPARVNGMPEAVADLQAANVLVDRDEWGFLLQLFTRSPYERNTLFYELIQRRGARGFGSENIRALYDAVEHDRQLAQ